MERIIAGFIDEKSIYGQLTEDDGVINGTIESYTNAPTYTGDYIVTPMAHEEVILETSDKLLTDDITVLEIPYYETSNVSGYTVYIG